MQPCRFWRFLVLHTGGMSENLEAYNVISIFDATCDFFAFKLFMFLAWGTCPLFLCNLFRCKCLFCTTFLYFVILPWMACKVWLCFFLKSQVFTWNHYPCLACQQRIRQWSYCREFCYKAIDASSLLCFIACFFLVPLISTQMLPKFPHNFVWKFFYNLFY